MKVAILFLLVGLAASDLESPEEWYELIDKAISDLKNNPDYDPYYAGDIYQEGAGFTFDMTGIEIRGLASLKRIQQTFVKRYEGYRILKTMVQTGGLTASGHIRLYLTDTAALVYDKPGNVIAESVMAVISFKVLDETHSLILLPLKSIRVTSVHTPGMPGGVLNGKLDDLFTDNVATAFKGQIPDISEFAY